MSFVGQTVNGWIVVQDIPYCGFDEPQRFWSRCIHAVKDGATKVLYGPDTRIQPRPDYWPSENPWLSVVEILERDTRQGRATGTDDA